MFGGEGGVNPRLFGTHAALPRLGGAGAAAVPADAVVAAVALAGAGCQATQRLLAAPAALPAVVAAAALGAFPSDFQELRLQSPDRRERDGRVTPAPPRSSRRRGAGRGGGGGGVGHSPHALLLGPPKLLVSPQHLHDQLPLRVRQEGQGDHLHRLQHPRLLHCPSLREKTRIDL